MLSSLIRSTLLTVSLTLLLTTFSTTQMEYQTVGKRGIPSVNIVNTLRRKKQIALNNYRASKFQRILQNIFYFLFVTLRKISLYSTNTRNRLTNEC